MSAQNEGPECQQKYTTTVKMEFPKPNYTMIFHNADNMQIGKLDFNNEGLEFEGNASESAIVFIDWIAQAFKGRLEAEYKRGFEEGKKHETNT
jgi:hypothetical protein